MEILQLLAGQMQAQQVSQRVGASPEQTQDALQAAVPLLLGALTRNAQQGQAAAIEQAVAQHGEQELEGFARAGQLPDMQDGQAALQHIFGGQQQAAANAVGRRSGIDPQLALQILSIAAPLVLSYLNRQRQQGGAEQTAGLPGGFPGGLPGGLGGQTGAAAPVGGDITSVLTSVLGGLLGGGMAGGLGQQSSLPGQPLPGQTVPAQTLPGGAAAGNLGGLLGTLNRALDRDGDGSALDEMMDMLARRQR
ncbi:hypothetical protein GCM10017783_06930 [Deinococcus piscis]|uniref:DUF937 domain-containing protein n=1 Tax=Deinococcus piscis TaxID=394230 RepID=A0ABQ3K0C7_9DEIO|nr:DUF937 domain-containing protein [Deinococcus piscis]GHF97657.1 hypothetical protein GCM10017783_06930 [Deinococcus piscis]